MKETPTARVVGAGEREPHQRQICLKNCSGSHLQFWAFTARSEKAELARALIELEKLLLAKPELKTYLTPPTSEMRG